MPLRCPTCAGPSSLDASNPWRPFCSERCRLIDLGAWLDERYAIAGEPSIDAVEDSGDGQAPVKEEAGR